MTPEELQGVRRTLAQFGNLEAAYHRAHVPELKRMYFVLWVMFLLTSKEAA
jgi:hypothetical protein